MTSRRLPRCMRRPVIGLLLALLAGCSWFGTGKPDWVTGTSRGFSHDQYVTGMGEGESVGSATEKAYASVAKVFKAEITSEAREWESYLLVENRGRGRDERRLTLDHVTNVSTDKVLENVQVLDKWLDADRRRYYVLAGVPRVSAETALVSRLGDMDRTISDSVGEARQTADKLARLRHLKRAVSTLVLRDAHNADLRVIRLSGQGIPAPYRVGELTAELERAVATVPIGIELTGDHVEAIARAVSEGLLREGLAVVSTTSGTPPDLLLKGLVHIGPIDVRDLQFRYVRWCSDFVLVEPASQRVVGALSRGDKIGHLSVQEATNKALRAIQQEFSSELAKTVAGYVYGETDPAGAPTTAGACPRESGAGASSPAPPSTQR